MQWFILVSSERQLFQFNVNWLTLNIIYKKNIWHFLSLLNTRYWRFYIFACLRFFFKKLSKVKFSVIIKSPYPHYSTHIRTSAVTTGRHWIETKTPDFFHLLFLFLHIICSFFEVDKTLLINECWIPFLFYKQSLKKLWIEGLHSLFVRVVVFCQATQV